MSKIGRNLGVDPNAPLTKAQYHALCVLAIGPSIAASTTHPTRRHVNGTTLAALVRRGFATSRNEEKSYEITFSGRAALYHHEAALNAKLRAV